MDKNGYNKKELEENKKIFEIQMTFGSKFQKEMMLSTFNSIYTSFLEFYSQSNKKNKIILITKK